MQRHPVLRAFATLWAAWFVLLLSEPVLLHPCPMHDGVSAADMGAAAVSGEPDMAGAVGMPEMASAVMTHHMPVVTGGESANPTPPVPHPGHSCSCLGDCALSVAVVPASAPRLAAVPALNQRAPLFDDSARALPVVADHVIPFANGPPIAMRA